MESLAETWRKVTGIVDGFPYEVSSTGRVRSLHSCLVKILSPFRTGKRTYMYFSVSLSNGPDTKIDRPVHTLVAEAFLGKRPKGKQVHHKNHMGTDNRVENLQWVTPSENVQYAQRAGRRNNTTGEANGFSRLTDKTVKAIRTAVERGATQQSQAILFRVCASTISQIMNRKKWKHI